MAHSCWGSALQWFSHPQDGQVQENVVSSRLYGDTSSDCSKDIVTSEDAPSKDSGDTKIAIRKRRLGGWRSTPFIFGNGLSERLAEFGLSINLITFLTVEMHMSTVKAANVVTNFGGTCGLTPLVGAFIADAYLGRYKTIAITSVISMLGSVLLTLSATVSSLRPPSCNQDLAIPCKEATSRQLWYFYTSLFLLAVGTGGIRPNTAAFGADQFDPLDAKEKIQLSHFFNWYYFSVGVSILGAVTLIVYVQDNLGWAWGFGIPAGAMAIALISFFVGSPYFRYMPPAGSPLTRIAQVIIASYRKRRLPLPSDVSLLQRTLDHKGGVSSHQGRMELRHTSQFTFLDKAAIEEEGDNVCLHASRWRLCTVHQIEELKALLRLAPIWACSILSSTVIAQQSTFSVQQARSMDRRIGTFEISAASFAVFGILMLLIWLPIYDLLIVRCLRKFTGNERGITSLQRIGTGLFLAILAMVAAATVEVKRRNTAHEYGLVDRPDLVIPISGFWLVPQNCLFGLAESFVIIGELEFFYDQSPESMRSTGTALFWTSFGIGSYVSTFLVTLLSHRTDWLHDNLNKGHLDSFYWFLAILSSINLVSFILSAIWFKYRNDETQVDVERTVDSSLVPPRCNELI